MVVHDWMMERIKQYLQAIPDVDYGKTFLTVEFNWSKGAVNTMKYRTGAETEERQMK